MAGFLSSVPILGKITGIGSGSRSINLPSVDVDQVETNPDKRARCLKHLIKANHVNYSVVYHNLQFDNHNPHILASAYFLGANDIQLNEIYEKEIKELEPWKSSPAEVADLDWQDFLGDRRYQRAYLDYFEDKLVMNYSYAWKKEVEHFLFHAETPLLHGLISGLGHPLIHLGFAYEVDSKELATEALSLLAVQYNFLHKYLDDSSYTKPSPINSSSPLDLLTKMADDKRFDSLPRNPDYSDLESIFNEHEELILEYWNGWNLDNPHKAFELSQEAAVALLVSTVVPKTHAYNFFVVHLLTTSHAVGILLPFFPQEYRVPLVRQWWLLVISVMLMKNRPRPDPDNIEKNVDGKTWKYVQDRAINSPWAHDAHYVKAIRSMKEAAKTWGDAQEKYLRAAVTFVDNFEGWAF
ncbi:unnamed protein product [Clonostachys rhizophaga]|uniref:Oxidoreductase AflY n=1 Tax=Clonostachys rhizophaga TaxID=160324 RepID=A0A9N9V3E4_9HYPO|nr:unnamed protein product [Clonostachys rhizophaga]